MYLTFKWARAVHIMASSYLSTKPSGKKVIKVRENYETHGERMMERGFLEGWRHLQSAVRAEIRSIAPPSSDGMPGDGYLWSLAAFLRPRNLFVVTGDEYRDYRDRSKVTCDDEVSESRKAICIPWCKVHLSSARYRFQQYSARWALIYATVTGSHNARSAASESETASFCVGLVNLYINGVRTGAYTCRYKGAEGSNLTDGSI
ncbi:hypothetical protein EDD85DRAFT_794499 [Armillaria nabsnona]|nr:hypothetical protein EDD85DRAFT_794499 [Armillaria nabsnona]